MISRGCFRITSRIGVLSIRFALDQLLEHGCFQDADPDPQADADQDDAEEERHAPAPGDEIGAGPGAEREDHEVRQEQAARHAELRPGGDQAAAAMGARPLHRDQHRAAPFAADADALEHAQDGQDDGAPDADGVVARHQGDQERRDAHQQKRRDQRRLAADAVAVMAEDCRADRAADKADEVGAECRERPGQRVGVGKKELWKHQSGGGAVDEEVIPLDGRADRRGNHGLAQLRAVLGVRKSAGEGVGGRHVYPNQACYYRQVVTLPGLTHPEESATRAPAFDRPRTQLFIPWQSCDTARRFGRIGPPSARSPTHCGSRDF